MKRVDKLRRLLDPSPGIVLTQHAEVMQRSISLPWLLICVVTAQLFFNGCVSRRMTVRSIPSGALVEIDGKRMGTTPVALDFQYYGTHEITLSMPGYETVTIQQPVEIPYYQRFPLDFISNHFLPQHVTDRHDFTYKLVKRHVPIQEEMNLLNRARNFRSQAQVGAVP